MNGMMLQSPPESKDIKFNSKKDADTTSKESGELFEELVTSLIDGEEKSENSNFLFGKLLNISSSLDQKGKKISEFSKDDLLAELETKIDPKSDKDDVDDSELEVALEDLFKIALSLKSGDMPNMEDIKSPSLKTTLSDKSAIEEFKSAKNIKELLSVADKNGVKVKNFEFFKEETALNQDDKKLVQKVTSQEIFKMIEPRTSTLEKPKASNQNILTELINKDKKNIDNSMTDTKINIDTSKVQTLQTTTSQEVQKDIKFARLIKTDSNKKSNSTDKIKNDTKGEPLQDTDDNKSLIKEQEPVKTIKTAISKDNIIKPQHNIKDNQNKLSQLLKNSDVSDDNQNNDDALLTKEDKKSIDDVPTEKNSNNTEVKTHSSTKVKDTHDVKKSLNTFASEFKEKVDSYKSPLMKVKMQLSPQNLGDVDVTLVNRGSTLQVNITSSNNNSMAIFMQNQAEFKNSLVNMGFSDLQMNFSQNGSSQNQQNKKKDDENSNTLYENIDNEEENDSIDIIIPNYV